MGVAAEPRLYSVLERFPEALGLLGTWRDELDQVGAGV